MSSCKKKQQKASPYSLISINAEDKRNSNLLFQNFMCNSKIVISSTLKSI